MLFFFIRFLVNMSRSHLTSKSKYMSIYLHYIDSIFNKTKPTLRTVKIFCDIMFILICVFYITVLFIYLFNSAFLFFSFFFFILHKHVQVIFNFQIKR